MLLSFALWLAAVSTICHHVFHKVGQWRRERSAGQQGRLSRLLRWTDGAEQNANFFNYQALMNFLS